MDKFSLSHLENPIVFLHQMRCGGNKLNFTMAHLFNSEDCIKLGQNVAGTETISYEDILQDIETTQRKAYLGHHVYGLHNQINKPVSYVTNMREPISRLVSIFTRFRADQPRTLLEAFANYPEAENGMTKRLAGIGLLNDQPYNFVTGEHITDLASVNDEIFDRAIKVLDEEIQSILLLEKINESYVMFEDKFSLPSLVSLSINHINQTSTAFKMSNKVIPSQWHEWLIEKNQYDIKLYEYAKKKVEKELSSTSIEIKEKIRLRNLYTSVLSQAGNSLLSLTDVLKNMSELFTKLEQYKMQYEFIEIAKQFLVHPELPGQVASQVLDHLYRGGKSITPENYNLLNNMVNSKASV